MAKALSHNPPVLALENPRFSPDHYWRARYLLIPMLLAGLYAVCTMVSLGMEAPLYQSPGVHTTARPITEADLKAANQRILGGKQAFTARKKATLKTLQGRYWPKVRRLAAAYGLDPFLVMAVIQVESRFDASAISPKGAMGLMQIVPGTAKHLGLDDPLDSQANLEAGVRYLSQLKKRFKGNERLMLAAYNAGPTKVAELGRVPDHKETRQYLKKVAKHRRTFSSRYALLASR